MVSAIAVVAVVDLARNRYSGSFCTFVVAIDIVHVYVHRDRNATEIVRIPVVPLGLPQIDTGTVEFHLRMPHAPVIGCE